MYLSATLLSSLRLHLRCIACLSDIYLKDNLLGNPPTKNRGLQPTPSHFHPSTGAGGFSRVSTSAGLLDWTELEPKTRPAISSCALLSAAGHQKRLLPFDPSSAVLSRSRLSSIAFAPWPPSFSFLFLLSSAPILFYYLFHSIERSCRVPSPCRGS